MTAKEAVIQEIRQVPESVCQEILDFVKFIKLRLVKSDQDAALASEKVLAKDWMTPEEDEAWRNL